MEPLTKDELLLGDLAVALLDGEQSFNAVHNWTIDKLKGLMDTLEPDTILVLASWGKAASLFNILKKMDEKERARVFRSRPDLNFDELLGRVATLEGVIDSVDETDTELFETAIDNQLETRAKDWQEQLEVIRPEFMDDETEDLVLSLTMERDELEYAAIGIHLIRARHPYFKGITKLKSFESQLKESDKLFKKLLGNRRELDPWADKLFWWRHPA